MEPITASAHSAVDAVHLTSRIEVMFFVGRPPRNVHTTALRSDGDFITISVVPCFRRAHALRRRDSLNEPSPQLPFVARTVRPPFVQSSQPCKHVPIGERLRMVPGGTRKVTPSSIKSTTSHDDAGAANH